MLKQVRIEDLEWCYACAMMSCYYKCRNLSVEGGPAGCEEMVAQDIMTPLCSMLEQV